MKECLYSKKKFSFQKSSKENYLETQFSEQLNHKNHHFLWVVLGLSFCMDLLVRDTANSRCSLPVTGPCIHVIFTRELPIFHKISNKRLPFCFLTCQFSRNYTMGSKTIEGMEQSDRDRECNRTSLASLGNPAEVKCMWHTKAASLKQQSKQQDKTATESLNGQLSH